MNGKNVVITGAAGGLGRATAVALAKAGAGVAVLDINEAGAQAVVDDIKQIGGDAIGVVGDITTRDAAHARLARNLHGGIQCH